MSKNQDSHCDNRRSRLSNEDLFALQLEAQTPVPFHLFQFSETQSYNENHPNDERELSPAHQQLFFLRSFQCAQCGQILHPENAYFMICERHFVCEECVEPNYDSPNKDESGQYVEKWRAKCLKCNEEISNQDDKSNTSIEGLVKALNLFAKQSLCEL